MFVQSIQYLYVCIEYTKPLCLYRVYKTFMFVQGIPLIYIFQAKLALHDVVALTYYLEHFDQTVVCPESLLIQVKFFIFKIYQILAWEPSVTYSYSRRLPALGRKLRCQIFVAIKVDPLNLESQNQAISVIHPCSLIKILKKSVPGFLSYDRTNKQTLRHRLQHYIQM